MLTIADEKGLNDTYGSFFEIVNPSRTSYDKTLLEVIEMICILLDDMIMICDRIS